VTAVTVTVGGHGVWNSVESAAITAGGLGPSAYVTVTDHDMIISASLPVSLAVRRRAGRPVRELPKFKLNSGLKP
jgi:hypothetical protein